MSGISQELLDDYLNQGHSLAEAIKLAREELVRREDMIRKNKSDYKAGINNTRSKKK